MRFKLDENLDFRLADLLRVAGYDTDTVVDEGLRGHDDAIIYEACRTTDRALITLDLDFSNPFRFPPTSLAGIVVLRPHRPVLPHIRALLSSVLPEFGRRRLQGTIWIVEPGRIRIFDSDQTQERP